MTRLEMTDDRNPTSHTYIEEVAEQIYKKIDDTPKLMEAIFRLAWAKSQGKNKGLLVTIDFNHIQNV